LILPEYIINQANTLFSKHGVKSVTMDHIARDLGISKKTIYQHFIDKNAIVVELMRSKMENQVCVMGDCHSNSKDAVHEVFLAVTEMGQLLSNTNPLLIFDVQKYHPQAWQYFENFRERKLFDLIIANLNRGIGEGNYRQKINTEILTWMRIGQIDTVFGQTTYPNHFSISALMAEITEHFLYGVCTSSGLKLIEKYQQDTAEIKT
jgi:AcrR family transcriptional regulator